MSTWEQKFNELQSQYESLQDQNESIRKEFEEFNRDKTTTTAGIYHGVYHLLKLNVAYVLQSKLIPPQMVTSGRI